MTDCLTTFRSQYTYSLSLVHLRFTLYMYSLSVHVAAYLMHTVWTFGAERLLHVLTLTGGPHNYSLDQLAINRGGGRQSNNHLQVFIKTLVILVNLGSSTYNVRSSISPLLPCSLARSTGSCPCSLGRIAAILAPGRERRYWAKLLRLCLAAKWSNVSLLVQSVEVGR